MMTISRRDPFLSLPTRYSFWFMVAALGFVLWLRLGPPLIAALFSFLALEKLYFIKKRGGKFIAVVLFLLLLAALAYGFGYLVKQAVQTFPSVADQAVTAFIEWARQHQVQLPFADYDSFKEVVLDTVKSQAAHLASVARFARGATSDFILVLAGIVLAIGLFLNPSFERAGDGPGSEPHLYGTLTEEIARRFRTLYASFSIVMGAQVVISAINTVLTAVLVVAIHLPYGLVAIGTTFVCGLLPVVGNLISNAIIIGIGITVSPRDALICVIFLVVVHKLEYFLNSNIVGGRIRNPFWLTLLALILGEQLMGIPGMVLAPVFLSYLKMETSRIQLPTSTESAAC